jgi:hypothetical protein
LSSSSRSVFLIVSIDHTSIATAPWVVATK